MSRLLSAGWPTELLDGKFPAVMASALAPHSTEMVAERLKLLREALGVDQAEMARQTGISPQAWNNAETGDNRIGLENANKVRARYQVGLDFIYHGDFRALPSELAGKIGRLNASRTVSKRA